VVRLCPTGAGMTEFEQARSLITATPRPQPVLPLVYGSATTSPEWGLVLRVLAMIGCLVAVGRVLGFVNLILFSVVFRQGTFAAYLTGSTFQSILNPVTAVLLAWGCVSVLRGRPQKGVMLMMVAECIAIGAIGLTILIHLASTPFSVNPPSTSAMNTAWYGSYRVVAVLSWGFVQIGYSVLYVVLLRAYRRASGFTR
jgi:hypothetical protein